jgi:hypothetical protein
MSPHLCGYTIHPSPRDYPDMDEKRHSKAGEANGQPLSDGELCAILGSAAVDVCEPSSCADGRLDENLQGAKRDLFTAVPHDLTQHL